jgi:filamentous hemagglutinin family protein
MAFYKICLFNVFAAFSIVLISDSAFGQEIQIDNTLGNESSIVQPETIINGTQSNLIQGGATRGVNLFHSFRDFNVNQGKGVYFNSPSGIERIITRVTGNTSSKIMGVLGVYGGNADLFLINPNGIIFGPNASLDLKGSFLASTASSIIFNDTQYSAVEPALFPLLSVNIPLGLKFRGDTSGSIVNQSQVFDLSIGDDPIGLRVSQGKTLALVGGDVTLEGGVLTAPDGRIELGSVAGEGEVTLSQLDWRVGYQNIQYFGDIKLLKGSFIDSQALGEGSGNISLQGKDITILDGSLVFALNFGSNLGGTIKIVASNSVLIESDSDFPSVLIAGAIGAGDGGDILIEAKKLTVNKGGIIQTAATSIVTEEGIFPAAGKAGNVIITTEDTKIYGGQINAVTDGEGKGGDITINSERSIDISESGTLSTISAPVNAPFGGGGAGNIMLDTKSLRISNGGVLVSSEGSGAAGNLEIDADSILLENKSLLSAQTIGGAGNIMIRSDDIVLRNSSITTSATGRASGGNIIINVGVLAALENSDITANSEENFGGRVSISAKRIFGTQFQENLTPESDITATSALGPNFGGTVELNITAVDPSQGLVELPATVVDPSTLVAQNPCKRASSSEFTRSGRGGLPPSLSQDLNSDSTQVGLVEPANLGAEKPEPKSDSKQASSQPPSSSQIVPAQGWVYNDKGEVVLVAYNSAVTGPQRLQSVPKGCPVL